MYFSQGRTSKEIFEFKYFQAIPWLKEMTLVAVFGVHLQTHLTAYFDSLQCLFF